MSITALILPTAMSITRKPTTTNLLSFRHSSNRVRSVDSFTPTAAAAASNFRYKAQACDGDAAIATQRRNGNYGPAVWDSDFIQSLSNEFNNDEKYLRRASKLRVQVEMMLDEEAREGCSIRRLELIDDLQRLGISYHFKDKIKHGLESIYVNEEHYETTEDLHATALRFRLLRQHGFSVLQDVFDSFKNDKGNFKASLADDTKGLLQLYEASFMLTRGENTLELAREFATKQLEKRIRDHELIDEDLSLLVQHALEIPLHWRLPKLHARWFMRIYERRASMNPIVLELAKLDSNITQAKYQEELKHVSRWWEETRLAKKLPFARDLLVECYVYALFMSMEPQHGYARVLGTKLTCLITLIDDVFDVHGTLEELRQFVSVIQRWDMEAMEKLPNYMQDFFLSLNNFINETACHVHKEQGLLITPYLRKSWQDFLETSLHYAELHSKGCTPKLEDYISNACTASAAFIMISYAYFLATNPIEKEAIESLYNQHNIIRYSGLILHLMNDLGTSAYEIECGNPPASVQCYMNETGASVDEAREHVKILISDAWKKLNEEVATADYPFQPDFVKIVADQGRMAHYVYTQETSRTGNNKYAHLLDSFSGLLFEPVHCDPAKQG